MNALIIGAGIGGATAAIALRAVGVGVTVCERAPEPREVGAGIALGANAMMALRAVGAVEPVYSISDPIASADLLDERGRMLLHTPVAELEHDLPDRSVLAHRADLLDSLLALLAPGVVRFSRECVRIARDEEGVAAEFADGSRERADVLIGADGIRSVVRTALLDDGPPRYSGYTGWRGIAPEGAPLVEADRTCELWGPGARFGYGRCGRKRVYWYATLNTPPGGADEPDPRPALLRIFGAWAGPVRALIESTPAPVILRNDIIDRPPVRRWGAGRVTLLGDAAHPTTPNLGQGACMAIEDAVVLARHLREAREPAMVEDALRGYERERMRRTAMITNTSWRLGRIGQWESRPACRVRNAVLALWPKGGVRRQIRSITGFRVGL